jgi:chromosome segregation ATPase
VLYLAEVKNQNKVSFVGGYKTELKLLASQSSDQTWNSLSGNESITIDAINDAVGKGALYILNLDDNLQLQSEPELAGGRVVNYLRQLSRTLEKSKELELEIEEWKDSLRLQGEQIGFRQEELDKQQQVISQQQQELAQLEQEKEKLNNAWEQIRQEEARSQQSKAKIQKLLQQFNPENISSGNTLDAVATINQQKTFLNNYWQQLQSEKNSLSAKKEELNTKQTELEKYRQELEKKHHQLTEVQISAQSGERLLEEKEEFLTHLSLQLESLYRLDEEVSLLTDYDSDTVVDLDALETMPLGDLESIVNKLQQETSKLVNFVNLQEEELSLHSDEVKQLEEKMNQVGEVEKFSLEGELADAQEAMKLLNETLVGQRKTLKKQQKTLNQHFKILTRRKGVAEIDFNETINVKPLINEIGSQRLSVVSKKRNLDLEIENLRSSQVQIDQQLSQAQQEYQKQKVKVQQKEKELMQIYQQTTETESKISLLEKILEPMREQLNGLSNQLQNSQPGNINISSLVNELQSMM